MRKFLWSNGNYSKFMDYRGYGQRDALGGDIFQNGSYLASITFNGRLKDQPSWGGRKFEFIDDFPEPKGLITAEPEKTFDSILQPERSRPADDQQYQLDSPKLTR